MTRGNSAVMLSELGIETAGPVTTASKFGVFHVEQLVRVSSATMVPGSYLARGAWLSFAQDDEPHRGQKKGAATTDNPVTTVQLRCCGARCIGMAIAGVTTRTPAIGPAPARICWRHRTDRILAALEIEKPANSPPSGRQPSALCAFGTSL